MIRKTLLSKTIACSFVWAAAFALSVAGCAAVQPAVTLEKTYWQLVEVKGVPSAVSMDQRPPHIVFDPGKKRVTGYSGVNNFFGGYSKSDHELRMPRLAATRRAGPPELMDLESAFFKALAATRSYRIADDELELLDTDGRTIARFRAERLFPSTVEK